MKILHRPHDKSEEEQPAQPAVTEPRPIESRRLYRFGFAYGRLVYRLRWLIIALWVIGVAVSAPFSGKVASVLKGGGYSFSGSESARVENILVDKLHQPSTQLLVVFQSASTPVSDPNYQLQVNNFVSQAQSFPHVTSVIPNGTGQDGRTTYVTVNFNQDADKVQQQIGDFRNLVSSDEASGPARPYITGNPAVYDEFTHVSQKDVETAEIYALPVALAVLIIVFGSLVAAFMPILLALVAVPVALAVIYVIALHASTSVFVLNVATIVGLGISIDYSLFMVRRFRDELMKGRPVQEAVSWTVATAGEAILFSGLTVMVGFLGLLLIGIQFMTSFGVGGAVVVAAAVTAALTLLPALLSVLGLRINALRVPLLGRFFGVRSHSDAETGEETEAHRGFWHHLALAVMKRPVAVILVVAVLLIALGWPIFSINIGTPTSSSLPASTEARQGLTILNAQFPETNENPILVVAQTPDGSSILTAANLARVNNLTEWLGSQSHVTGVVGLMKVPEQPGAPALTADQLARLYTSGQYQYNPELAKLVSSTTVGDTTLITLKSDTTLDSGESKALINDLRAGDTAAGQGLKVSVGGFQAVSMDFNEYLYGNFPKAILFILAATYVLLLLMFRSALLPLKAILVNVLSVSAAYGALVFIFQWGNFENFLGFTSTGFIDSPVPILMFCILFGLSMDYEVFLLSRIREEWLRTHNNRWAVAYGLEKTGGVITNAALLFVIVTGAFTFTSLIITKEIGLGMTVAVLVDAVIIRTLLVPAAMRLLGRWNWWLPGLPLPPKQSEEAGQTR